MKLNHNHIRFLILLLALGFTLGGCKTKMGMVKTGRPESADLELIRSVLKIQDPGAGWELKATVRLELEGEKHNGILTIRLENDRRIWASFRSALGIEVARAYATQDSVWVSSKLLGIKEKGSWRESNDILGIPLSFFVIKAVVTRQLDAGAHGDRWMDPSGWRINTSGESRWMEPVLNGGIQQNEYKSRYLIETPGPVIREMVFDDIRHMWNIRIRYEGDDEKGIDRMNLELIDHNQNAEIQLKYLSVDKKNSLEMPFEIF